MLVKWWLLAIPQYLVIGFLEGGPHVWGGGLTALLTIIAGFFLLFKNEYPRDLFDLIVGFNRWVFVSAPMQR